MNSKNEKNNLPCLSCNAACCGPIPLSRKEIKFLRSKKFIPNKTPIIKGNNNGKIFYIVGDIRKLDCFFLSGNRCLIYDFRPDICRKFGEIPELPCSKVI